MPHFENCYIMQKEDIRHFANTLADGFSEYVLFRYICNGEYKQSKMSQFWTTSITTLDNNAICIADSKNINSVLIYLPPTSKEPGLIDYFKAGAIKMLFKVGLKSSLKLRKFDLEAKNIAKPHINENTGYILAFATQKNKQGQHYGKPLISALTEYLDATGQNCYLETLKAGNVEFYKQFSFELKEEKTMKLGNLKLYTMYRPGKEK